MLLISLTHPAAASPSPSPSDRRKLFALQQQQLLLPQIVAAFGVAAVAPVIRRLCLYLGIGISIRI